MKDYYEILGIPRTANLEQIKKAYRIKAVKYHPDKHFGDKYFVDKFINANEAYKTLSNNKNKHEYDIEYDKKFAENKENPIFASKQKDNSQFYFQGQKPFYSHKDRAVNETIPTPPLFDHWGAKISEKMDFFEYPKNIGKLVTAYSTLNKDEFLKTDKEKALLFLKPLLISLGISILLILIFRAFSFWGIFLWISIPASFVIYMISSETKFEHTCSFIGVNGFAEYKIKDNRENIVSSFEINFKEITDLVNYISVERSSNKTTFHSTFAWISGNKIIREQFEGFDSFVEKYWTVYLLDNLEKELETKGYIEFCTFKFQNEVFIKEKPLIQLGVGYIKFLSDTANFTYYYDDIKRVYTKDMTLYIEHKNYEKKLFFFESGNKNGISLQRLLNRKYFYRVMELFLGYKINSL